MSTRKRIDLLLKEYVGMSVRNEKDYGPPSSPPPVPPRPQSQPHWDPEDTGQYRPPDETEIQRALRISLETRANMGRKPNPLVKFRGTGMWEFIGDMHEGMNLMTSKIEEILTKLKAAEEKKDTRFGWLTKALWKGLETTISFGVLWFIAYMMGFHR
jgi:hypothetical protein